MSASRAPFFRFLHIALLSSLTAIALTAREAHAYYSTIDTGDLVAPGEYQVSFEPQYVFTRYSGLNAVTRFDTGLNESSSIRGVLGLGTVNFELGAFFKWVPFPDTESQPAIGAMFGGSVARVANGNEYNLRVHPMISKRFETEIGDVTPYASLPIGFTSRPEKNVVPIQLTAGAEIRPLNMNNLSFFGEIGADVNDSFGYISVAIAYQFDEQTIRAQPSED